VDVELGVTYPRMMELIELHQREHDRELYGFGAAMNAAMANPKELRKLDPTRRRTISNDQVPPQLRIPRRKRGAEHG
jgi:hypothetical protein